MQLSACNQLFIANMLLIFLYAGPNIFFHLHLRRTLQGSVVKASSIRVKIFFWRLQN